MPFTPQTNANLRTHATKIASPCVELNAVALSQLLIMTMITPKNQEITKSIS